MTRHERVAAVHAALDSGRYVEIRSDAGVGKPGVLKHFAKQITTEGRVVVLSPGRTIPGWTAMRAVLGFDGTAHDLLSDLAGDGGGILFVDNLDFFNDEERRNKEQTDPKHKTSDTSHLSGLAKHHQIVAKPTVDVEDGSQPICYPIWGEI